MVMPPIPHFGTCDAVLSVVNVQLVRRHSCLQACRLCLVQLADLALLADSCTGGHYYGRFACLLCRVSRCRVGTATHCQFCRTRWDRPRRLALRGHEDSVWPPLLVGLALLSLLGSGEQSPRRLWCYPHPQPAPETAFTLPDGFHVWRLPLTVRCTDRSAPHPWAPTMRWRPSSASLRLDSRRCRTGRWTHFRRVLCGRAFA